MKEAIRRGDIYYARLDPTVGSEQAGVRPVLVMSNDVGNKYSPTIVIVPITSRGLVKKRLPTHTQVRVPNMLKSGSIVLTEQIRAIDTKRLREYVGRLPNYMMRQVERALLVCVDIKMTS